MLNTILLSHVIRNLLFGQPKVESMSYLMEVTYICEVFSLMGPDPVGLSRIPRFSLDFPTLDHHTNQSVRRLKLLMSLAMTKTIDVIDLQVKSRVHIKKRPCHRIKKQCFTSIRKTKTTQRVYSYSSR